MKIGKNAIRNFYIILLAMYFATIPIENVLETGYGSVHKFLGIGILLLAFLLSNLRFLKVKYTKNLLLFVFLCAISYAWTFTDTRNDYLRTVLFIVFFTIITLQVEITESEFEFIRFIVCAVSAVLSMMMIFGSKFRVVSIVDANRYTFGLNGVEVDQNNLCLALGFSIVFAVDYCLKRKNKYRFIYILFAIGSISGMLFSGSRGGLLALIISVFSYLWIYGKNRFNPKILIFCFVVVLFIYYLANQVLPETILSRLTIASVIQSGGTGRIDIWKNAIYSFNDSDIFRILFGYGFGSFPMFSQTFCGVYKAAHNDFVEFLIELGVVGLVFYLICIAGNLKRIFQEHKALQFAILVLILVGGIGMEVFIKKMYWVAIYFSSIEILPSNVNTVE